MVKAVQPSGSLRAESWFNACLAIFRTWWRMKILLSAFSLVSYGLCASSTGTRLDLSAILDEVESLAAARQAAVSGTEVRKLHVYVRPAIRIVRNQPSDAVRVVNAVLTQLDQLRAHDNVIILTTSNITGAIDLAFVDRADIKQYVICLQTTPFHTSCCVVHGWKCPGTSAFLQWKQDMISWGPVCKS